jgi:hypothetical protein
VAVVSVVHVAVCTPEASVIGNHLDCQRNAIILLNSCKFFSFLSLLSVVLIVTGIEAVMCIPSPLTRLRNNGDFQKITAHTMKVMATSLFVLLSQF